MSAKIFSLFLKLPKEIQIQIYRHASTLNSSTTVASQPLDITYYMSTIFQTATYLRLKYPSSHPNSVVAFFKLTTRLPFRTRVNMMATCLLARQIALETWLEDLSVAPASANGSGEHDKRMVIEYLERQIKVVHEGDGRRL